MNDVTTITPDQARVILRQAGYEVQPDALVDLNGSEPDPARSEEWMVPASELALTNPEPQPWLLEGLLRPGIGFVAAEPKSGKTWLSLEVALAIATGRPAFGRFEANEQGPVCYVVEEGSEAEVSYRLRALCAGHEMPVPDSLLVAVGRHVLLDDKAWQARILKAAAEGVRAFVFDPLVRMHTGNEDRAEAMRPVNSFLRTLAYSGSSPIVNHHWTKPGENTRGVRLGNRMRGTGDFWALCDSILYLSRVKGASDVVVESEHRSALEEPSWSFALPTEQDPDVVRLEWRPGGVEEMKAQQKAPAVLRAVEEAGMFGINATDLRANLGGSGPQVDAAAAWLVAQGQLVKIKETGPDKAGRSRQQVVFRRAE